MRRLDQNRSFKLTSVNFLHLWQAKQIFLSITHKGAYTEYVLEALIDSLRQSATTKFAPKAPVKDLRQKRL